MRSVTFADAEVVVALNERFVCCWVDLGSRGAPPEFTAEQLQPYAGGGGDGAVTTLVALPDGRTVHEIAGWVKPKKFLDETGFAAGLTAENVAAKREGRAAPVAKILGPVSDAVGALRSAGVG